jgi:hypothetical protein
VSTSDLNLAGAARDVRDGLAAGDRRRRAREATRRMWLVAPALAAICLATAALARWAAWSPLVPICMLAAAVALGGIYFTLRRRPRPLSDAAAAIIDADARMAGELRSASWFAARDLRDDWAALHVERAAERLRTTDWRRLYPAVRSPRAGLATAAMVAGALALTVTMPERVGIHEAASAKTTAAARAGRGPVSGEPVMLSPELEKQLAELLAAAESGNPTTAEALARNADLRDMLNRLSQLRDPALLEALARALAAHANAENRSAAEDMKALADRARKAAESTSVSREMQDALEKLADELDSVNAEEPNDGEGANASSGGPKPGESGEAGAAGMQDLSIQFAKEADPEGGAGVLMMSSQDDQGAGPPGGGVGGSGSEDAAAGTMANIEAALKEELVEASDDNAGANVETEIRRKTEHGNAAVAFTGSAAGTFDRTRVATPPPVPEARRSGVQTYFVRKPQ